MTSRKEEPTLSNRKEEERDHGKKRNERDFDKDSVKDISKSRVQRSRISPDVGGGIERSGPSKGGRSIQQRGEEEDHIDARGKPAQRRREEIPDAQPVRDRQSSPSRPQPPSSTHTMGHGQRDSRDRSDLHPPFPAPRHPKDSSSSRGGRDHDRDSSHRDEHRRSGAEDRDIKWDRGGEQTERAQRNGSSRHEEDADNTQGGRDEGSKRDRAGDRQGSGVQKQQRDLPARDNSNHHNRRQQDRHEDDTRKSSRQPSRHNQDPDPRSSNNTSVKVEQDHSDHRHTASKPAEDKYHHERQRDPPLPPPPSHGPNGPRGGGNGAGMDAQRQRENGANGGYSGGGGGRDGGGGYSGNGGGRDGGGGGRNGGGGGGRGGDGGGGRGRGRGRDRDRGQDDGGSYAVQQYEEEEPGPTAPKEVANLGLSGKLAAETNKIDGVELKHQPPADAHKPDKRWRLYVFKNGKAQDEPIHLHRNDHYLFGRDIHIADVAAAHPSVSKQHAVLQFRQVSVPDEIGLISSGIRPYIIDLDTVNGTFLNAKRIESLRYHELMEQDVIKFGLSTREYVLLHDKSTADA